MIGERTCGTPAAWTMSRTLATEAALVHDPQAFGQNSLSDGLGMPD